LKSNYDSGLRSQCVYVGVIGNVHTNGAFLEKLSKVTVPPWVACVAFNTRLARRRCRRRRLLRVCAKNMHICDDALRG